MSSVECLREFVNERLTSAAEEIFTVFIKTIVEYEEEIDRQRRLLDIVWKPEIKLHRIELPQQHGSKEAEVLAQQQLCNQERNFNVGQEDPEPPQIKDELSHGGEQHVLNQKTVTFMVIPTYTSIGSELPQQHVCKEEVLTQQQLCNQERNSSLDQEDPVPPQIKEEQEEFDTSQGGKQLVLKQESDTFMLTPTSEETECNGNESQYFNPYISQSAAETVLPSGVRISWLSDESDDEGRKHVDSGSTRDVECEPQERLDESNSHTDDVSNSDVLKTKRRIYRKKNVIGLKCQTCGRDFKFKSLLEKHLITHSGLKPFFCNMCGKGVSELASLKAHMRIHTGEKPFICKTCGKGFACRSGRLAHMRIHTSERRFACNLCEKSFKWASGLNAHLRTHSGEKPYTCKTCWKDFTKHRALKAHMRKIHGIENRANHNSTEVSDVVEPI